MLTRTVAQLRAWRPSTTAVRQAMLAALVMNTVIVVTGGAVRLTASPSADRDAKEQRHRGHEHGRRACG